MYKRIFSGLLLSAMILNTSAFAQVSLSDGVYREDFEGYRKGSEIINGNVIISEDSGVPELYVNDDNQLMSVKNKQIDTNVDVFAKELNVVEFDIGADSAPKINWGSASGIVLNYTNSAGNPASDYLFDFAYAFIRHGEFGKNEKKVVDFSAGKYHHVVLKFAKKFNNGEYLFDITYSVDGVENKREILTSEPGTMYISFKSVSDNKLYVDNIEVSGSNLTKTIVNIADREDVCVLPDIYVTFAQEIDSATFTKNTVTIGDSKPESVVNMGGNKYKITLASPLEKNTEYVLDMSNVRDLNNNELAQSIFEFKTKDSAIIADGSYIVNTSDSESENVLLVFPSSVLPLELYENERFLVASEKYFVVTEDYRPVLASYQPQNISKISNSLTAEFDSSSKKLSVYGKVSDGEELVTIVVSDSDDNILYTLVPEADSNGHYGVEYTFTSKSGKYTVLAKTMDEEYSATVKIRQESDKKALFDIVNSNNKTAILNALETYDEVICSDFELYTNLSDKSFVAEELAKISGYNNIDKLVKDIEILSLIGEMKDSSDMYALFEAYEGLVLSEDDGSYELWDKLSDTDKATVLKAVMEDKTYTPDKFVKEIYVRSALKTIANTNKYIDVKNIIENHYEILGISLDDYNKAGKPSSVAKGLCGLTLDSKEFVTKFDALVHDAEKDSSSSSGGSGGGGGGSKGGVAGGIAASSQALSPMNPVSQTVTAGFGDIGGVEWAQEAIAALSERKLINGYGDGTFRPNAQITREEFVSIIVRYLGLGSGAECSFSDVPKNAWYYDSVATAAANGIIKGISATEFGSGQTITRQDAAVILYSIGGFKEDGTLSFTDSEKIADYAKQAVAVLSAKGIINGFGDGRFEPAGPLTRAQAAQLIYSFDNRKEADK